jgi:lysyl-tRNA synthetase class 2
LLRRAAPGAPDDLDLPELLDWLFATRLQPALPEGCLSVVHDFPACQAALARLKPGQPLWAERFEVFAGTVELANGYRELTDPVEQRRRFDQDNRRRRTLGRQAMPVDQALIEALEHGLPECSGVALGVDRLMMIALDVDDIGRTLPFPG